MHPVVSKLQSRDKVDAACKKRTAPWVRVRRLDTSENGENGCESTELCDLYENYEDKQTELKFSEGVYNLADIREYGKERTICPYFLARKLIEQSNIIVFNYLYMLDANMTEIIDKVLIDRY